MNQHSRALLPRRSSGFTLNELLFVVAVVALLAAILFPVFAKARDRDIMQFSCQSNLKIISTALDQYMQDHDQLYPDAFNDQGLPPCPPSGCEYWLPSSPNAPDPRHTWETSISPYLPNNAYLACPHDPLGGQGGNQLGPPAYTGYKGFADSYSANGMVSCYTAAEQYSGCYCRGVMCESTQGFYVPGGPQLPGKKYSQSSANAGIESFDVHHPETTIAMSEVYNADALPADNGGSSALTGNNGHYSNWATWHDIGGQHNNYGNYVLRVPCQIPSAGPNTLSTAFNVCGYNGMVSTHHGSHGTYANFLYCDGHVAARMPRTTNPTPDAGNPPLPNGDTYDPNNEWDATRP